MTRGFIIGTMAAMAAAALATVPAAASEDSGRPLSTVLSGAAEAPGPGDPDGSGTALITLNQGQNRVCWKLVWADIAEPTAAHIHVAPAGVAGPVVVPLSLGSGCASVDPALIKAIRHDPENYYVNIHNAEFPAGAIRGQLG